MLSILAGYHRKTKEEPGLLKKATCMLEQAFHALPFVEDRFSLITCPPNTLYKFLLIHSCEL
jgi:hypothetical protein